MARPRRSIGEIGSISFTRAEDGDWVARARVRMPDGRTARPRGHGETKTLAEKALREAVTKSLRKTNDALHGDPTISDLIDLWQRTDHRSARLSETSRAQYDRVAQQIRDRIGRLRVSEATTMRLEGSLFSEGCGPVSGMRVRKVVLSKIFASAVRRDLLPVNPALAVALPTYSPGTDEGGEPIALTEDQAARLLALARDWQATKPRSGSPRTTLWPSPSAWPTGLGFEQARFVDSAGSISIQPRAPSRSAAQSPISLGAASASRRPP